MNFLISASLTGGSSYYVRVRGYGSSTGAYTLSIAKPVASNVAQIQMAGLTSDSITIKAQYPINGVNGNELKWYDNAVGQWVSVPETTSSTLDGYYAISGLTPLTTYQFRLIWCTDSSNSWLQRSIDINVGTPCEVTEEEIQEMDQATVNELIRQNVPLHTEPIITVSGEVTVQWGTAGNDTHGTIARQAGIILRNDKGDAIYNKINEYIWDSGTSRNVNALVDLVIPYASEADKIENDLLTYSGHFYGPGGVNYLPVNSTSPTAYERFNNHYYLAKMYYQQGNKGSAYRELGLAVHYLSDLNAPHHAANLIVPLSFHGQYETWVNNNVNRFLISSAPSESYEYLSMESKVSFKGMADNWSAAARAQIAACNTGVGLGPDGEFDPSGADDATRICLSRSQRAAAALYYRFITDTGRRVQ